MVLNVVCCTSKMQIEVEEDGICGSELLCRLFPNNLISSFYLLCEGKRVDCCKKLENEKTYHIVPRVLGGKGGFGSMLRAIGAQIEKTTSREACRDLSGRRMRDINNEKQLKEWLAKEADREKEKEERRQERLARRLNPPQHKFEDTQYDEQRAKVQEDLEDALSKGLKRAHKKTSLSSSASGAGPSKKQKSNEKSSSSKEWLGVDLDSDDLESDSDNEAHPGDPEMSTEEGSSPAEGAKDTENTGTKESEKEFTVSTLVKKEEEEEKKPSHLLSSLPVPVHGGECMPVKKEIETSDVASDAPVDLELYTSEKDLAALGLDRLKYALMSRGLKCGGTLDERAQRLFSIKGLAPEDIDPALFAKSKGKGKKSK